MSDKVAGPDASLISNADRTTAEGGDNAGILDSNDYEKDLQDQIGKPDIASALPERSD